MELKSLKDVLSFSSKDIEKYNVEQLRLVLATARHAVRIVEKEINRRESSVDHSNITYL